MRYSINYGLFSIFFSRGHPHAANESVKTQPPSTTQRFSKPCHVRQGAQVAATLAQPSIIPRSERHMEAKANDRKEGIKIQNRSPITTNENAHQAQGSHIDQAMKYLENKN